MSKKKGVKRGSQIHLDNVKSIEAGRSVRDAYQYDVGMIHAWDVVMMALGRMGVRYKHLFALRGERFWNDLDAMIKEVNSDYHPIFEADKKEDPADYAYSVVKFDRELSQYIPADRFCDWKTRYDFAWHTDGLRFKDREEDRAKVE